MRVVMVLKLRLMVRRTYSDMFDEETAKKYQTFIYLAGSASAELIADVALCPMEAVKVRGLASAAAVFWQRWLPALDLHRWCPRALTCTDQQIMDHERRALEHDLRDYWADLEFRGRGLWNWQLWRDHWAYEWLVCEKT